MPPSRDGYIFHYLFPGECYISGEPAVVQTVLGSCVAVTMYDPIKRTGVICHCILPSCRDNSSCAAACDESFKYVDCSLRIMLAEAKRMGMLKSSIEVKLFGGGDMLEYYSDDSIGKHNVNAALKFIRAENLNLVAFDVGETYGRKMLFYTDTGGVYLKRLFKTAEDQAAPTW